MITTSRNSPPPLRDEITAKNAKNVEVKKLQKSTAVIGGQISALRKSDAQSTVRYSDRAVLLLQRVLTAFREAIVPLLRVLPGMTTKIAVTDFYRQFSVIYPKVSDELSKQEERIQGHITAKLKKDGYSDSDMKKSELYVASLLTALKSGKISPEQLYEITHSSPELLSEIAHYQDDQKKSFVANKERLASLFNALGSVLGLSKNLMTSASKITSFVAPLQTGALLVARNTLSVVTKSVAMPLSAALVVRDGVHIAATRQRNQQIAQDKTALDVFSQRSVQTESSLAEIKPAAAEIKPAAIDVAQQLLAKKRYYNNRAITGDAISAGVGVVGIASGIATLSGVAAPVGMALSGVGIAVGAGGSVYKAVYKSKENIFLGQGASESARQITASRTEHNMAVEGVEKTIENDAALMNHYQMMLAESKLDSLIQKVLDKHRDSGSNSAAELHREVELEADRLINRLTQRWINPFSKGSSLLASDLAEIKVALQQKYSVDFFEGSIETVQGRLNKELQENMSTLGLRLPDETLRKMEKQCSEEIFLLRHGDAAIKQAFMADTTGKKKKTLTGEE